ncbi:TetR/AcrR family transcriptional regulator [Actinomadura sp. DC4]|uniref:TetR/AcrR family transcriptional regulator n=1 Tax=Actinomadura sp. DC4 TaxID=3055069 RepID=UPI0025B24210|nr:TetR/AcrR family transcriptional regulator [Actinomadura sp. DC4]MDN3354315.1 TetR/AcrR family transcriptional regulator [Actinomadura sp. DC4]
MANDRPLRADARRNRERLLQTAKTAFAEEGLSVSLDEIARRAGVGPGTLYRHFPTKESLFAAVVDERLRDLLDHARALLTAPDAAAALFALVERLAGEASAKRDLVDALAGTDVGPEVAATAAGLRAEIGRLLSRAQESGAIRPDVTTADLMALLSGLFVALRPGGADTGRAVSVLCEGLKARTG